MRETIVLNENMYQPVSMPLPLSPLKTTTKTEWSCDSTTVCLVSTALNFKKEQFNVMKSWREPALDRTAFKKVTGRGMYGKRIDSIRSGKEGPNE